MVKTYHEGCPDVANETEGRPSLRFIPIRYSALLS